MKWMWVVAVSWMVGSAAAEEAGAILGEWKTDESIVEIVREDGGFAGYIRALEEPLDEAGEPKRDVHNPDPDLRDRPIEGLRLMWGFSFDGEDTWEGGRIYDPRNGKTYHAKASLEGDVLKLRGSIDRWGLVGRTAEWRRPEG